MKETEVYDYLESIKSRGIVPGLDSIRELCRRMGNPQNDLKFIHIAGTNGKGSVLAYLSTVLKCAGYKVGRYLSPTVFTYRERIQVSGRPITKAALCEGMELIRALCGEMTAEGYLQPTPFEVETALAFWYFQKNGCDIVALEAGMGGREDATNLITTTLEAVITSVSMDHMQFLGNTLPEIAREKAGIIKNGCYVISMRQEPEVMRVLEQAAEEMGCPLGVADPEAAARVRYGMERQRFDYGGMKDLEISLAGTFQIANAVLAVKAVQALEPLGFPVAEAALRRGLRETAWRGRFSVIGRRPLFVADGAHNEDAARKLAQSVEFYFTNKRIIYIMGILRDKDHEKMISLTHRFADHIITVAPPGNPRSMSACELADEVAKVHPLVTAADSLEEAVEMAYLLAGKEDVILAFGSLSYLGRLISIVEERQKKKGSGCGNGRSGKN